MIVIFTYSIPYKYHENLKSFREDWLKFSWKLLFILWRIYAPIVWCFWKQLSAMLILVTSHWRCRGRFQTEKKSATKKRQTARFYFYLIFSINTRKKDAHIFNSNLASFFNRILYISYNKYIVLLCNVIKKKLRECNQRISRFFSAVFAKGAARGGEVPNRIPY